MLFNIVLGYAGAPLFYVHSTFCIDDVKMVALSELTGAFYGNTTQNTQFRK